MRRRRGGDSSDTVRPRSAAKCRSPRQERSRSCGCRRRSSSAPCGSRPRLPRHMTPPENIFTWLVERGILVAIGNMMPPRDPKDETRTRTRTPNQTKTLSPRSSENPTNSRRDCPKARLGADARPAGPRQREACHATFPCIPGRDRLP